MLSLLQWSIFDCFFWIEPPVDYECWLCLNLFTDLQRVRDRTVCLSSFFLNTNINRTIDHY